MRTFFGLTSDYMKSVNEQFFFLIYHGNWSYREAYNLPIHVREWFVIRLNEQIERENEPLRRLKK
jgi:hypothetical protein